MPEMAVCVALLLTWAASAYLINTESESWRRCQQARDRGKSVQGGQTLGDEVVACAQRRGIWGDIFVSPLIFDRSTGNDDRSGKAFQWAHWVRNTVTFSCFLDFYSHVVTLLKNNRFPLWKVSESLQLRASSTSKFKGELPNRERVLRMTLTVEGIRHWGTISPARQEVLDQSMYSLLSLLLILNTSF